MHKIEPERLLSLRWNDVLARQKSRAPNEDPEFERLDATDFAILKHHAEMGIDYAAVVARRTKIDGATVFERQRKLRNLKLLARVEPKMIQYRKGIVSNKWIKHRNHTYYELSERGRQYLDFKYGKVK